MIAMPQGPTTPPERAFFRQLLTVLFVSAWEDPATVKKVALERLQIARDTGAFDPVVASV